MSKIANKWNFYPDSTIFICPISILENVLVVYIVNND